MRVIALLTIAILFMVVDYRGGYFDRARNVLSSVVAPIQYAVDWPLKLVHNISTNLSQRDKLIQDNINLRTEQLLLRAKSQELIALERENRELHALLKSSSLIDGEFAAAQLLAVHTSLFRHKIILNKGSKHKVFIGQPVVDATGIVGQVVQVGSTTSTVLLLTDIKSAIPVFIERNGVRAILQGAGDAEYLQLIHVPKTTEVQVGDKLLSSGVGLRFPEAYPVAVITDVQSLPGEQFVTIYATPSAHLDRSRVVLLVWPNKMLRAEEGESAIE